MSLVNRIRLLAKQQGLSISALEKLCGFGNGTIRKWDEQSPSVDRIIKVANQLNLSLDKLLTDELSIVEDMPETKKDLIKLFDFLDERDQEEICQIISLKYKRHISETKRS